MKIPFMKNKTVTFKLFALSMLQILIPILVIGIFSTFFASFIITRQISNTANMSFSHISETIDNKFDSISDISAFILYDRDIYKCLISGETDSASETKIKRLLENSLIKNDAVIAVNMDINSQTFSASKGKNSIYPYDSVGYLDLKRKVEKTKKPYWQTDTIDDAISALYYATPIYYPYSSDLCGMLILQIDPREFTDYVGGYNVPGEKNYAIIANSSQYVLKPEDNIFKKFSADFNTEINGGEMERLDNLLYTCYSLPEVGWTLVFIVEFTALYKNLYILILCIFCLCALSAIMLICFYDYMKKDISLPLYSLATKITDWGEDETFENSHNSYSERHDEIGLLYSGFQKMTKRISDLIKLNYKSKITQTETELKMLQSQINPHFLFNTLESINALAYVGNVPQIGNMTRSLSRILDRSIRNTNKYVPLSEELGFIEDYVLIMQNRYSDKFSVEYDIAEETKKLPVPNLILQPIIENSLKHGIVPSNKKCTVLIKSYTENNDMVITVSDNGVGIEKEKLEKLNDALKNAQNPSNSVGLFNTSKRLTLLFGNEYAAKIESELNEFTRVTLRFNLKSDIYKNIFKEQNKI